MALVCDQLRVQRGGFELRANWALPKGARVAVIGPSGAGKSLLLGAIAGFEELSLGRVTLDGQDLSPLSPAERPATIMFQSHNLFPHLSAGVNVGLGIAPNRSMTRAERVRVDEALASVGLKGFADRLPGELSGGQASRVALARALVRERPLLLLDEPFSALGPGLRRDMLALVADIQGRSGATVLYVTHAPEEAETADLAVFVEEGYAAEPVAPNVLFANPPAGLRDYL